jgi:hypothetical protein
MMAALTPDTTANWPETGTLAPGLTFSGGVITGTPTAEGRYLVKITVTDTEAAPQSYSVSFIIDPIDRITCAGGQDEWVRAS